MPGPFWWLEPMEYGFQSSKSTHRPSRLPIHTRLSVRLRATVLSWAAAGRAGSTAAAPAARAPVLMSSRRLSPLSLGSRDIVVSSPDGWARTYLRRVTEKYMKFITNTRARQGVPDARELPGGDRRPGWHG